MLATRRLPGIVVDAATPSAVEALPRMDVAVLVGFASTGPLHLPVAIESVPQFTAVFGADAPLAWDGLRGERLYAHLGAAVRAFFANGGRRCWVVRVARVQAQGRSDAMSAISNKYVIPGVLELANDGSVREAMAQARCEGAWSDGLRVASALQQQAVRIEEFISTASPDSGQCSFLTTVRLHVGDLIGFGSDTGPCAYAIVNASTVSQSLNGFHRIDATLVASFERLADLAVVTASSPGVSPPNQEWAGTADLQDFAIGVPATLSASELGNTLASLRFDVPTGVHVEPGHWIKFQPDDNAERIWLRIDDVVRRDALAFDSPASPSSEMIRASVTGPAWRELDKQFPAFPEGLRQARLLTLELRVHDLERNHALAGAGAHRAYTLSPVGLTPTHANAWWNHWSDEDFYKPREDVGGGTTRQRTPTEFARFPLVRLSGAAPVAWIPLGVEPLFSPAVDRLPLQGTALERDGLSSFEASLFVDPELAGASVHDVTPLADDIRFLRPNRRPLLGVHAALSIGAGGFFNEVSLLAIPDAIHLGWSKNSADDLVSPNPPPTTVPPHWRSHRGACATPDQEALAGPDFGSFLDCSTRALVAPSLFGPDTTAASGSYVLTWSDTEPEATYVLREATSPDFAKASEIPCGRATEYRVTQAREGVYYYQVYASVKNERSALSQAVTVVVRANEWVQVAPDEAAEATWLAIHRAALRMAAASGDLLAILTMPRHFRTQEALRYTEQLRAVLQPPGSPEKQAFGFTEGRVISHGAMYFPWLQSLGQICPPDGVALGVMAARASARGAWIAPANEPMRSVEALTPAIPAHDWQTLLDMQINVLRVEPRGFLTMSADTLATELDLRPISVRRLLNLLRRLAIRRGTSYVFEPNGPALRRAVERGFGILLNDLFRRGAFAGSSPEQSYRVVTDDTVNTREDGEAGRFVVELRVAPSFPMRFISLQLAHSGTRLTVSEEL